MMNTYTIHRVMGYKLKKRKTMRNKNSRDRKDKGI